MDSPCDSKDVVLVIDDEEAIAEMISELVEEFGCARVSFDNSAEALQHYEEGEDHAPHR